MDPFEKVIQDAIKKAKQTNEAQHFELILPIPGKNAYEGVHGLAYPCGCVSRDSVLSDGTVGWGEWLEPCSIEHIEQ